SEPGRPVRRTVLASAPCRISTSTPPQSRASILAVLVPHPIQPLTREEVRALADKVFDAILNRITAWGADDAGRCLRVPAYPPAAGAPRDRGSRPGPARPRRLRSRQAPAAGLPGRRH